MLASCGCARAEPWCLHYRATMRGAATIGVRAGSEDRTLAAARLAVAGTGHRGDDRRPPRRPRCRSRPSVCSACGSASRSGLVGALLLGLRRGNLLGPVLFVSGASLVAEYRVAHVRLCRAAANPGSLPAAAAAGWAGMVLDPLFFPVSLVVILLLFPDGRLSSRGWRAVVTGCVVVTVVHVLAQAVRPGPIHDESFGYQIPWSGLLPLPPRPGPAQCRTPRPSRCSPCSPSRWSSSSATTAGPTGRPTAEFRPLLFVGGLVVVGLAFQAVPAT